MNLNIASWIINNKKFLQVGLLSLGVVAVSGPWAFDLINVPSQYACSAPNVRLEGDYCGVPLSGMWLVGAGNIVNALAQVSMALVAGSGGYIEIVRELLGSLIMFPIVLPFLSTLLSFVRRDGRFQRVFNVCAWGLAIVMGLLFGLSSSSYPRILGYPWGIWLYIGVAASALTLEVAILRAGGRPNLG